MLRITDRSQLVALARELGTRKDWHEPDEQGLTASLFGTTFDNAGFWASADYRDLGYEEIHVILYKNDHAVAAVNLATLFAWAAESKGAL